MPTIIYIAGSPRSGTTLLDRIIGGSKKATSLGEIVLANDYLMKKEALCACGKIFVDCDYWGKYLLINNNNIISYESTEILRLKVEGSGGWKKIFLNELDLLNNYKRVLLQQWHHLFSVLPEGSEFLVDSSKSGTDSIWRPIALKRVLKLDVKMIHMVRDVRGVMNSHHNGSNIQMEEGREELIQASYYITLLHWLWVNSIVALQRFLMPKGCFLTVSYEQLTQNPYEQINRIEELLGLTNGALSKVIDNNVIHVGGHQVYGNRMRFKKTIVLLADNFWQKKLPRIYKVLGAIAMRWWQFFQKILNMIKSD